jgi:hypothetical protein
MQLLQSVAVINEDVFLVTDEKEVSTLVETHTLTIFYFECFILSEFIMQNVIDSDFVKERGCHIIA